LTEPSSPRRSGSFLVAAGIFLSRVAGLIREIAVTATLGVGAAADAFKAALRIPNLLQNLLGEGVLSASFIPVYSKLLDEDDEEAGATAGAIAGILVAVSGVLCVLGVVFAEPLTKLLAPGFEGDKLDLTVDLVRIITPGVGFLVLSAWCLGILNSHRRFFLSYVAPVVWNAAQVAAVVAAALLIDDATEAELATALAWGVLVGGVLQLLVQLPAVRRLVGRIRWSLDARRATVRDVIRRFWPALLGRGAVQLVAYVDLMLASILAVGAVSALTYAQVLYLLPISLFGMSVAAAELPELSRLGAGTRAGRRALRTRIDDGMGRMAFFVAPTQAVYLTAGGVITAALFQRGEFTADDATLVWLVLAGYSLALMATTASRLLQNSLFALGDTRTPAWIAFVRVLIAAVVGLVLMFPLDQVVLTPDDGSADASVASRLDDQGEGSFTDRLEPLDEEVRQDEDGPVRLGAVGLSLGASVGAWFELALLRRVVGRRIGKVHVGGRQRGRVVFAAVVAGLVALGLRWSPLGDLAAIPEAIAVLVPSGLAYLAVAWVTGVDELRRVAGRRRTE
jgi:putative peptidoglycan lipid II flippase